MVEQEPPSRVELVGDYSEKEQQYLEMAEANPIENLEQLIGDVCTKLSTLNKRETDINKNSIEKSKNDNFFGRKRDVKKNSQLSTNQISWAYPLDDRSSCSGMKQHYSS